jgi:hypothetical protein
MGRFREKRMHTKERRMTVDGWRGLMLSRNKEAVIIDGYGSHHKYNRSKGLFRLSKKYIQPFICIATVLPDEQAG